MCYSREMKIAMAQINPLIGDFDHNRRKIETRAALARERGCDLVVFPELAVSGYPPQDLLERPAFLRDNEAALRGLVAAIDGIAVLCGSVERHNDAPGKPLHNSAVLFAGGRILFTTRKRLLPTYDVFDESRYFTPGGVSLPCTFQGVRLGITVCEDIWNDPDIFTRRLYDIDPVADLAGAGVDLLINISASPFHLGKESLKHTMFARLCRRHRLPLLYVNQVGGQDSLLFDGHSLAMDRDGLPYARGARFREELVVIDSDDLRREAHQLRPFREEVEPEEAIVYEALVMGVRDYVTKCGFSKGVLGLSGGIDSALTAALACDALGPDNVLGVALPSPYTSAASLEDAGQLAANLGCRFETIPITPIFETFLATLAPLFKGMRPDVAEQNLQARIRGNLLMALANKFGSLLLSTGNKSEMAVGYCTLYGDMSGGLAVIADVPKQLVYRLSRYRNRQGVVIPERTLSRPPSAELAPGQLDQDDLPPYEILDPIVTAYLEEDLGIDAIVARGYERPVVEDVVRRIKINEYKRKQAPIGLKVTSKSFGFGRRYPTAQNYRG